MNARDLEGSDEVLNEVLSLPGGAKENDDKC
jgi:hypothetical protein